MENVLFSWVNIETNNNRETKKYGKECVCLRLGGDELIVNVTKSRSEAKELLPW